MLFQKSAQGLVLLIWQSPNAPKPEDIVLEDLKEYFKNKENHVAKAD